MADAETIGSRFAGKAAALTRHPAVVTENGVTTFGELAAMADRITAGLARHPGQREEPLALILREGPVLYAVMLAAARLGRMFVPLDPSSPEAWLSEIIASCGARYVVTDEATAALGGRVAGNGAQVLRFEVLQAGASGAALDVRVSGDTLLCVVYTSGSTGRPKGVMINHRATVHRAKVRNKHMLPSDRMAHLRSSSFSAGINDTFSGLLNGVTLFPYDVKTRGLRDLSPWLAENRITGLGMSSSALRAWLHTVPKDFRLPDLRLIIVSSEPLYGSDVALAARHLQGQWAVVHQLGSTESGPAADQVFGPTSPMEPGTLPVGRPVEGFHIRLEDESGNVVGAGEIGEIVLCSRYLASGYWKDPDLTRQKFLPDPDDPSRLLYRTGDLGRWRSDGNLELLGRNDRKVKIRGHSVELYEVEQALLRIPSIRDAVVLVSDSERLLAYVAAEDPATLDPREVRRQLFSTLPAYMVPPEIVVLDSLPLTPRGKIDRKALPSPGEVKKQRLPRGPRTALERQLLEIWRDMLKRPDLGPDDDFFVAGGDSLQATQLILEVEKRFGIVLPAEAMFGPASTIAGMAREIENAKKCSRAAAHPAQTDRFHEPVDVDFAEFKREKRSRFYVDPRTGLRRAKPNTVYGAVVMNAQGYRNPELAVPKPPGTVRLAFLGSSTTYDPAVSSNEATWAHLTCEMLKAAFPHAEIDYVNAGLTGFNTRQLVVLFREYVGAFEPDIAVIFASDRSDLSYLARRKGLFGGVHFRPSWLGRRFRLWYLMEKNLRVVVRLLRAQSPRGKLSFTPRELTAEFESRLEELVRACQESCPAVALLTTASRLRRSQSRWERMRAAATSVYFMPYMSIEGILDAYDAFDDAIRRVAKRTGAILIEPKAAIPGDGRHYADSSHFLDAGSRRMAECVAAALAASPGISALMDKQRSIPAKPASSDLTALA